MGNSALYQAALKELAKRELAKREYQQPPAPDGMEYDPKTGQMVDTSLIANRGRSFTGGFIEGTPLIGPSIKGGIEKAAALTRTATNGGSYDQQRQAVDQMTRADETNHPYYNAAGQVAGMANASIGAFNAGATASRFVNPLMRGGKGLAARTGANVVDGVALGALDAAGRGENPTGGMIAGGGSALIATPALAALGATGRAIASAVGIGGKNVATRQVVDAISRSGKSKEQIISELQEAAAAGQPYTLADVLGHPAQRRLAAIGRTPGAGRDKVVSTMLDRQAGQGERLQSAVAKGLGANQTAKQMAESLKQTRSTNAQKLYPASVEASEAVNVKPVIEFIDGELTPGVMQLAKNDLKGDSISSLLLRTRQQLATDQSMLTDYRAVLNLHGDINKALRTATGREKMVLGQIQDKLKGVLAKSSKGFRKANDTYAKDSRAMDAVELGKTAAMPRQRAEDTIEQFARLKKNQKAPYRTGYGDSLITRLDSKSVSPTTNKAGLLMKGKFGKELPTIEKPGAGLFDFTKREQNMFDTAHHVLGGSKTADNLADAAQIGGDVAGTAIDLSTGNLAGLWSRGLRTIINNLEGSTEATRSKVADALLQQSPTAANRAIAENIRLGRRLSQREAAMVRAVFVPSIPLMSNQD